MFENLIEEKIRVAMEAGEFDNLPGKGKPIDLEAYFATPPEVRLGYSLLKSAGCLPEEVALLKEVEALKAKQAACPRADERDRLEKEIKSRTLKLNLLLDGNRRRQGRQRND